MSGLFDIDLAAPADFEKIWPIFQAVVSSGDTYAYAPDTSYEQAFGLWMQAPLHTYIAKQNDQIVGSYFLKANQPGLGSHVANCGYMVSPSARGQGVARLMCEHSQQQGLRLGFKAMQFNFVVSTNHIAVQLWQKMGFEVVGRLPKAFDHQQLGLVDAFVMYKQLASLP
jgi:ribosomal protein S18 acetylase RimI-like enzyme